MLECCRNLNKLHLILIQELDRIYTQFSIWFTDPKVEVKDRGDISIPIKSYTDQCREHMIRNGM